MDVELGDFVIPVESPVPELSRSFKKNYQELEKLALDTVNHCSMPCFNVLQDLTKSECKSILKNNFWKTKPVIERAVLLSILTDYIACSYSNSPLYQTFEKKSDRKSIYAICIILNSRWCDVFRDFTAAADIEESQILSALKVLKDSVKRLENVDCFFQQSYHMAERAMEKLKMMSYLQAPICNSPKSTTHKPSNGKDMTPCTLPVTKHVDNKEKFDCVSSTKIYEKSEVMSQKSVGMTSNSPGNKTVINTKPNGPVIPALQPRVKAKQKSNILRYFKKPSETPSVDPKFAENESSKENIVENLDLTALPCLDLHKDESSPELHMSPERKRSTVDSPVPNSPVKKKFVVTFCQMGERMFLPF